MRMSGSDEEEMKLPSSAVLFFMLWKLMLVILSGLWACLCSGVVIMVEALLVGGSGLFLVGDKLV